MKETSFSGSLGNVTREELYSPCEGESSSVITDFAPLEKRRHKRESRRFSQMFSSDLQMADEKTESESDLRNKFRYSSLVLNRLSSILYSIGKSISRTLITNV